MTVTNCFRSDVQQLVRLIDELEASGKKVTVTRLKSASKKYRKSAWTKWHIDRNVYKLASQTITHFSLLIMNRDLAIGLLSRASNGDDLLTILDSLVEDEGNTEQEEIQFW